MGHSQADKAESHDRIVGIAARRMREVGVDGISIPDIMRDAGLTHGGFYRHFGSRDQLVAEALDRAMGESKARSVRAIAKRGAKSLETLLESYLHPQHRDEPGKGCAIAAMAADVGRGKAGEREILTRHLRDSAGDLAALMGPGADDKALGAFATLIGALILSRAVDDPTLSDEILASAGRTVRAAAGK
jgi:TetR/AcrR family transcriptional repressor of nem operon